MNTITQTMKFRQALIEYSLKYGVTKAAIRYKTNRQYIYRWRKRYDGTLQSLADKSHKPHHHPNEHTPDELKLIENMRKRNPNAGLVVFVEHLIKKFPFKIECVQTDNGQEFTKKLGSSKTPTPTMFEAALEQHNIKHKLIRPYTPRHNGKVERSHRKDNEYFYATHTFYSFADFAKQLKVHNYKYNKFPMRPLNWKAPVDYIKAFLQDGEIF